MSCDVVFFSPMCVLDNASGAAICMRTYLETLSAAGLNCQSFTASIFDPREEVSLAGALNLKVAKEQVLHKVVALAHSNLTHNIFITASSRSRQMTADEQRLFIKAWRQWLTKHRPRIVLSYGSSDFAQTMRQMARDQGAKVVHYLANAEFKQLHFVQPGDEVICPSRFLSQLYESQFGVSSRVLYPIIEMNRVQSVASDDDLEARRKLGFVTFMNPIPHKGLALIFQIAQRALANKAGLTFLITEGRIDRAWLQGSRYNLLRLPNVWLLPNQANVQEIYRRTSLLLVPSLWREGFGRNIVEAQLSGIPVLANDIGGIPEAINGGGQLFTPEEATLANFLALPDRQVVEAWWQGLSEILNDQTTYRQWSQRALAASAPFRPEVTRAEVVNCFNHFLAAT